MLSGGDEAMVRELLTRRRELSRQLGGLTNIAIARKLCVPVAEVNALAREQRQPIFRVIGEGVIVDTNA